MPELTAEVGAVIDRDYYPGHDHQGIYNWTKGEKINIIKIWWHQTARIRQGAYVEVLIPYNIKFKINQDQLTLDEWPQNKTRIECQPLQNVESNLRCEIINIVCHRNYDGDIRNSRNI